MTRAVRALSDVVVLSARCLPAQALGQMQGVAENVQVGQMPLHATTCHNSLFSCRPHPTKQRWRGEVLTRSMGSSRLSGKPARSRREPILHFAGTPHDTRVQVGERNLSLRELHRWRDCLDRRRNSWRALRRSLPRLDLFIAV